MLNSKAAANPVRSQLHPFSRNRCTERSDILDMQAARCPGVIPGEPPNVLGSTPSIRCRDRQLIAYLQYSRLYSNSKAIFAKDRRFPCIDHDWKSPKEFQAITLRERIRAEKSHGATYPTGPAPVVLGFGNYDPTPLSVPPCAAPPAQGRRGGARGRCQRPLVVAKPALHRRRAGGARPFYPGVRTSNPDLPGNLEQRSG